MHVTLTTTFVCATAKSHFLMQSSKKHLLENRFVTLVDHMTCCHLEKRLPFWDLYVSMYLYTEVGYTNAENN